MSARAVNRVVVIGRDAPLWLAASVLRSALRPAGVSVVAVELPTALGAADIHPTLPPIEALHHQLGIDEAALIRATGGAFTLGQNFTDHGGRAPAFLHAYGAYGTAIRGGDFFAYWLKARGLGLNVTLDDFSLCGAAARQGRLMIPDDDSEVYGRADYAYHLPALAYSRSLKSAAAQLGVEIYAAQHFTVDRAESAAIAAVMLDDDRRIAGDLFVDATGVETPLTGRARESWRAHFPADRVLTATATAFASIPVYAELRAAANGWTGLYPAQAKTHVIHAFSSTERSDDEALRDATAACGLALDNVAARASDPGCAKAAWTYNCVAIGAAACAFDPLHSVDLHTVQLGLIRLLALFPAGADFAAERAEYNRLTRSAFARIRDFQAAHYALNRYGASPFWTAARQAEMPSELAHLVATFRVRGTIPPMEDESFAPDSWRALLIGHGVIPASYPPAIDRTPPDEIKAQFRRMLGFVRDAVMRQPTHDTYLASIREQGRG